MITNKELNVVKLSPTKKDFYQIWNELLETAGKISERWDPTSTNESDPGIVLLKVLTAVADKLNYNIDANTLEAFMPSAAQEDSMRKLTEMLGYNMKYYQSATTEVKISYDKNIEESIEDILVIDKFTNLKDIDDSINYVTLAPLNLSKDIPFGNVECMEGELVECETADNNIVSIFHLDDNKRYFLPETQIAENSIFITNIENNIEGTEWRRVSNLNAQSLGSKIFKFGFDSQEGLPFIQFPEDISTIIEDGLRIKYIRTSGNNGNISVNTLTKLTTPSSWALITPENKKLYHDAANFSVTNIRAATNGTNKEGINSAYNNFKKTIGTFDTLVTCRDYMNKIYQLVSAEDNTTPLVSNIIVSDIRSDINRAVTLGTFTNRGIEYKVMAKPGKNFTNFDLLLYPFKSTYGLNSKQEYNKSFNYDDSTYAEILAELEDSKTLAHNLMTPTETEIACIKNYYRLRAKINTIRKVGTIEQASILNNVYKKLFETFNMRQLDFGEEIPYDTLLNVIETADPRIKNISLDEPVLTTNFLTSDNKEHTLSDDTGKTCYNTLVLNNVLAGRTPLFNYNTDFVTNYNEKAYPSYSYAPIYPTPDGDKIYKLKSEFEIPVEAITGANTLKLTEQEVVQFKAPSLKTTVTYPAYVNYYFRRNKTGTTYIPAIPATMQTLRDFLKGGPNARTEVAKSALEYYVNDTSFPANLITTLEISSEIRENENSFKTRFEEILATNCAIFTLADGKYSWVASSESGWNLVKTNSTIKFYTLVFNKSGSSSTGFTTWNTWLLNILKAKLDHTDSDYETAEDNAKEVAFKGFYKVNGNGTFGYLVEAYGRAFKLVETSKDIAETPFDYYYVPRIWSDRMVTPGANVTSEAKDWHTANGLGQDAVPYELTKGIEYELTEGEYLLINYSQSKSDNSEEKEEICKTYGAGTIIKPNFVLADSEDWAAANHSYTKLNVISKFDAIPDLPGMFTLGTNEQIEIREIMQVQLDNKNTNLYWEIPNLVSTTGGYIEFPWDEEPVNPNTGVKVSITPDMKKNEDYIFLSYTLKEGEYLYYTDMNKSDIAFYGFGSTIKRGINTPTIFKYVSDDLISAEEIATNGINTSIPWRNYNLSDKGALTITENQFINLTEGDTLSSVTFEEPTDLINNEYKNITGATWKYGASANEEEAVSELPTIQFRDSNYKWQIRSKLNLAVGPNKYQTLKTKDIQGSSSEKVKDKVTLVTTAYKNGIGTDEKIITLYAYNSESPLSFKTNQIVQSATTITDVTARKLDDEGNLEEILTPLQLKLFEIETVKNNLGQIINLGNYGDKGAFTTINFEEQLKQVPNTTETDIKFDLNLLVPEDNFGLLMVYYQKLDKANSNSAKLTWGVSNNIKHYNEDSTYANALTLREGINIIQIKASDVLTISSNQNNKAIITFGTLDLISTDNSINPKLNYKAIEAGLTDYTQILKDIRSIDNNKEFYYNIPIAQNLDIDMNPNDSTDTLENPLNWFNYNNINNKFVIAEIDTEHLTDDIVIAKSSRSNF